MMTETELDLSKRVEELEKCVARYEAFFNGLSKLLNVVGEVVPFPLTVVSPISAIAGAAASDTIPSAPPTPSPAPPPVAVSAPSASDADLDGPYGDPKVFRDPPDWEGESYVGKKFSECPTKYLLETAKFLDWAAADDKKKNILASNNKPRHVYRELDAKRARGWAARLGAPTNTTPAAPKSSKIDPNDADYTFDDA